MKNVKFITILFFCFSFSFGQTMEKKKNIFKGLSIEIGGGYGTLTHNYNDKTFFNKDTIYQRKKLWIQPTVRISYSIFTYIVGSCHVDLTPFFGYYNFGGKSSTASNGYKDILSFKSLELGLMTNISGSNKFVVSPSFKAQYIFNTEQKYYGTLYQPDSFPRKWEIQNNNDLFKIFASNVGLNIKYKYNKVTFGIEGWYGISNLGTINNDSMDIRVRENNYRLLIGYEF